MTTIEERRTRRLPWVWGAPVTVTLPPEFGQYADARPVTRSVAVRKDSATVFDWLSQLRRAPYSYDWIDNFGIPSPMIFDPTLRNLEMGQLVMTIFTIVGLKVGESMTLEMKPGLPSRMFGSLIVQYRVEQIDEHHSRLTAAMWMLPSRRRRDRIRQNLLAWGDLVMMRKQLRVLSNVSETVRLDSDH